ncbi:MAG: glycosyltransferase family 39 protein [Actinobacteria bacterium]|nr:glycosyltransferase family 39 protein [Actinomycetota bacterium]
MTSRLLGLRERNVVAAAAFALLCIERMKLIMRGVPIGPDEIVYSGMAYRWLGRIPKTWAFAPNRSRGIALIITPLYWVKHTIGVFHRVSFALLSLALVGVTYLIGRRFLGPAVAAITAMAFGLFRVNVFTSIQLLPDVPAALVVSLAFLTYWRAVVDGDGWLWPIGAFLGMAFFFNPAFSFLAGFAIAVDFLIGHRREILSKRVALTAGAMGIFLGPYFIRAWIDHGSPFTVVSKSLAGSAKLGGPLPGQAPGYVQYARWFFDGRTLFGPVIGAFVIAGFILLIVSAVRSRPIPRKHATAIIAWLVIPSVGMALLFHAEGRFLMVAYPAFFLTVGVVVKALATVHAKIVLAAALIGLALFGVNQYRNSESNLLSYNIAYGPRHKTVLAVRAQATPPCRIFAFTPVLFEMFTPCTASGYSEDAAELERLSANVTTYYVEFGAGERNAKPPPYLHEYLDSHAVQSLVVANRRRNRVVRVYVYTG